MYDMHQNWLLFSILPREKAYFHADTRGVHVHSRVNNRFCPSVSQSPKNIKLNTQVTALAASTQDVENVHLPQNVCADLYPAIKLCSTILLTISRYTHHNFIHDQ